jgi:hypothetical protein
VERCLACEAERSETVKRLSQGMFPRNFRGQSALQQF